MFDQQTYYYVHRTSLERKRSVLLTITLNAASILRKKEI